MFKVPEKFRIRNHPVIPDSNGNSGAFKIEYQKGVVYFVIASDELGWEHVSVTCKKDNREVTPNWEDMCRIKDMFWGEEDCVVQYHPPKSEYVNIHKHCLHLWRPTNIKLDTPPSIMVGFK